MNTNIFVNMNIFVFINIFVNVNNPRIPIIMYTKVPFTPEIGYYSVQSSF